MTLNDNNQYQMNSINNTDIIDKLNIYYNIYSNEIPEQRIKSEFHTANYHGFFKGIIEYGDEMFKNELDQLLNNELQSLNAENQTMHSELMAEFFIKMFSYYIFPFKLRTGSDIRTNYGSEKSYSDNASMNNSKEPPENNSNKRKLNQKNLNEDLKERDKHCLFCWDFQCCHGAHIIAQEYAPILSDVETLFERAGLKHVHDVQNGLFLCLNCHKQFNSLKRYVDFVDEKFVLTVVNETNDPNNVNYRKDIKVVKNCRATILEFLNNQRLAVESNEEMGLYFIINDEEKLPNKKALEFHKAACLIWRMAGGAESDDEYCSDDEELGQVNTAELKERYNWKNSDETMNMPLLSE